MTTRKVIRAAFFALLSFALLSCSSPSSRSSQLSDEELQKRLVGEWIQVGEGEPIVFGSDGNGTGYTVSSYNQSSITSDFVYAIADGKIAIVFRRHGYLTYIGDFYFSSDGKTLIIGGMGDLGNILLQKKK